MPISLPSDTRSFVAIRQRIGRIMPDRLLQFARRRYYAHRVKTIDESCEPDLMLLKHLLRAGEHAVDAGANIGIYTKFISRCLGPNGRLYSIEPVPLTFDILVSNVRALKLSNVRAINCAVSDADGAALIEVPLWSTGAENFARALIVANEERDEALRCFRVRTVTLDSILAEVPGKVSFIKLDVEGHELQCLRGASETVRMWKPAFLVEVWADPRDEFSDGQKVFHFFQDNGYQSFWFEGGRLLKYRPGQRSLNYWFLSPEHIQQLLIAGIIPQ